jgi:hypothetical protein
MISRDVFVHQVLPCLALDDLLQLSVCHVSRDWQTWTRVYLKALMYSTQLRIRDSEFANWHTMDAVETDYKSDGDGNQCCHDEEEDDIEDGDNDDDDDNLACSIVRSYTSAGILESKLVVCTDDFFPDDNRERLLDWYLADEPEETMNSIGSCLVALPINVQEACSNPAALGVFEIRTRFVYSTQSKGPCTSTDQVMRCDLTWGDVEFEFNRPTYPSCFLLKTLRISHLDLTQCWVSTGNAVRWLTVIDTFQLNTIVRTAWMKLTTFYTKHGRTAQLASGKEVCLMEKLCQAQTHTAWMAHMEELAREASIPLLGNQSIWIQSASRTDDVWFALMMRFNDDGDPWYAYDTDRDWLTQQIRQYDQSMQVSVGSKHHRDCDKEEGERNSKRIALLLPSHGK